MKLKWFGSAAFWGIMLILAGGLFLLQNLGILPVGSLFIGGVIGFFGLMFVSTYLGNREQWWALIPGIILVALACLIMLDTFFPGASDTWGGTLFLGGMGLSFWAVYLVRREHWWAIIPGGVLVTLGVVAGLGSNVDGNLSGAAFFLGLGLTFILVAVLPNPAGKMTWAYIPGSILLAMGALMLAFTANLAAYVLPAVAIFFGVLLLVRALRR
jgi:hypothetical protein